MRCTRHAFTLLELAVVLVVVGLMAGFGVQAFSSYQTVGCYDKTTEQINTIRAALQQFAANNSRYPKPAYMATGSNSGTFGAEASNTGTPNAVGYATEVPTGMVVENGVLIGAVPHATLGLPSGFSADCWGSKFTYAVTNTLTSSNPSNGYPGPAPGAIQLNTGTSASPATLSSTMSYVIVSHGDDKFGATPLSASDTTARNCDGATATKADKENCDTGGAGNRIFFDTTLNMAKNATDYFDDIIAYDEKVAVPSNLVCWGTQSNGQLGNNNSSSTSYTPAPVYSSVQFTQLVSNPSNTVCASDKDGYTYCWGANNNRHGGQGHSSPLPSPTQVGTYQFRNIELGVVGCGINNADGNTYCWGVGPYTGTNMGGQIAPTLQPGGLKFTQLEVSDFQSGCGITATGAAYCWGSNTYGHLGTGDFTSRQTPAAVVGGYNFEKIKLFTVHACGLTTTGQIVCWGQNNIGQLGNGTKNTGSGTGYTSPPTVTITGGGSPTTPISATAVLTGDTVTSITVNNPGAGYSSIPSVNLTGGGGSRAYVTGSSINMSFSIGTVTITNGGYGYTSAPTVSFTNDGGATPAATATATLSASQSLATINLTNGGSGYTSAPTVNITGGGGSGATATATVAMGTITGVTISARGSGYTSPPTISFSGGGGAGAVATSTIGYQVASVNVSNGGGGYTGNQTAIFTGGGGTGAVATTTLKDGFCTSLIPTLNNTDNPTPTPVSSAHSYKDVIMADETVCGLRVTGEVDCWGHNNSGTIGDGTKVDKLVPTAVAGGLQFKKIWPSFLRICGITTSDRLYCWGYGYQYGIGDGAQSDRTVPTASANTGSFRAQEFDNIPREINCAITTTNDAFCWGVNDNGRLGTGNNTNYTVPVALAGGYKMAEMNWTSWGGCGIKAACAGTLVGGHCYYWANNQSCDSVCADKGGCSIPGIHYASMSQSKCLSVVTALGGGGGIGNMNYNTAAGAGCFRTDGNINRDISQSTCAATIPSGTTRQRVCACAR